jgi:hypothetical protein
MKKPLIGREDLEASIGQGKQTQGKVMEAYQGRRDYLGLGEGKGREGMCEEKISSYVWKGVVHEKDVCKK